MSNITNRIAELLEASGYSPEDAQRLANEAARAMSSASKGTTFGNLDPIQLWEVWQRAARAGARKLTLEIAAEGHDQDAAAERGTVSAHVIDVELWENWTPEQAAQRAATDALLMQEIHDVDDISYLENDPRAGWTEIDYLANGEECPDVYMPETGRTLLERLTPGFQEGLDRVADTLNTQARARAEDMN